MIRRPPRTPLFPYKTHFQSFRHSSWWNKNVYDSLAKHSIIFCGINMPALPNEVVADTSIIYYRFHGKPKLYRSEEHTLNSSHSQISYAVFCLKKKKHLSHSP